MVKQDSEDRFGLRELRKNSENSENSEYSENSPPSKVINKLGASYQQSRIFSGKCYGCYVDLMFLCRLKLKKADNYYDKNNSYSQPKRRCG